MVWQQNYLNMNIQNKLDIAIARIKKIPVGDWHTSEDADLLWREFIRRFYKFKDTYPEKEIYAYYFNVEEVCDINFSDELKASIKTISKTSSTINKIDLLPDTHTWLTCAIFECYLLWNAAIDQNNVIAIQFQDLYEPVIRITEAGIFVAYKNPHIHIGGLMYGASGLCNRSWAAKEPIDIDTIQLPFFESLPD